VSVVVVGSANIDLVSRVERIPAPGETVLSTGFATHPGGKGNNQATAAARAGAATTFVGAFGDDEHGARLRASLTADGVRLLVRSCPEPTGTALIAVSAAGENSIAVNPGANATLTDLTDDERTAIAAADIVLLQLEIPLDTVLDAARAASGTVVLNAAPARELPGELLDAVDLLVVNEHEAALLGGGDRLLAAVPAVVVTLGADGALVHVRGADALRVPGIPVDAVDTTGAGDTFCGALVARLDELSGPPVDRAGPRAARTSRRQPAGVTAGALEAATLFATTAAALSVQRPGAVPSIPTRAEIDPDEANTNNLNPLLPRPIDRPTTLPLDGDLDPATGDVAKIFAAPDDPADRPAWRAALHRWRDEARTRLAYDGSIYERPGAEWTRSCYSVALVWLWDERLFDRSRQRFDVAGFLERTADHGGFDGVVLWHAYPVIGIDDRNQFDFYRDVPGLRALVAEFQARGLRVFLDYNPWDTGTRRADHSDAEELALLAGELGTDGMFLDTMKEGDATLVAALLDAGQVLEGESRVPNQRIEDHQLSWAQWFADSAVPGVMRARWYEPRHMTHSTRRWNRDHGEELRSSFLNGAGMLVWDAVFGVWVGWNERDKATLRRMLRVQRACTTLFEGDWEPLADLTPAAVEAGVYASRFSRGDLTLWTVVNSGYTDFVGAVVASGPRYPLSNAAPTVSWFDLVAGVRLGSGADAITVPARGVAAVLAVAGPEPAWLADLLTAAAKDPGSTVTDFPARTATRVRPRPSTGRPGPAVRVTGGRRTLPTTYRRRETGTYQGAPYVEEWKPLPPRLHDPREERLTVSLSTVDVAVTEVTNGEFAEFLAATGYKPLCDNRFHPGGPPDAPGTMVDLDDARAYATWAGARLPTEFEWQVAAGQPGFRRATPLVWNWTESEHTDGVTRFAMLKGGSAHETLGSDWYVDGGPRDPSFSLKFLLPGLGIDRSPAIGFRLAWEAS
jgi:ribokinase